MHEYLLHKIPLSINKGNLRGKKGCMGRRVGDAGKYRYFINRCFTLKTQFISLSILTCINFLQYIFLEFVEFKGGGKA
jgi:hypothetical protein